VKQRFNPVNAVEKRRNACDALGHCDKQSCIVSEGTPDLSGWHLNPWACCRMNAVFLSLRALKISLMSDGKGNLLGSNQDSQEVGRSRTDRCVVGDDDGFRAVTVVGHGLGGKSGA
jgi:hypothetical protein